MGTVAFDTEPVEHGRPQSSREVSIRAAADAGFSQIKIKQSRDSSSFLVERRHLFCSLQWRAVDSAFNALAETVLVQNARTLEDLVREMLRPMLKVWLDDNLPRLVERLVRAEIERVSRGRTS